MRWFSIRIFKGEAVLDAYCGIRDLAILEGNVEVDPDQDSFIFEVDVGNRQLVCNGHGCG